MRRGGWDEASLARYRAERAAATDLVGGFVITPYVRPKQEPVYEHGGRWSPYKRRIIR